MTYRAATRGALVDDAMVERGCRAVCAANGWNPDEPVTYSGTRLIPCNPDGSKMRQWQMHEHNCRAAIESVAAALARQAEGNPVAFRFLSQYSGSEWAWSCWLNMDQ